MKCVLSVLLVLVIIVPVFGEDQPVDIVFNDSLQIDSDLILSWDTESKSLYFYVAGKEFELLNLLKRCREFIDDYSDPIYEYGATTLEFKYPPSRLQYLNQKDSEDIIDAQDRIDRRKREVELAKDIDGAINILNELSNQP